MSDSLKKLNNMNKSFYDQAIREHDEGDVSLSFKLMEKAANGGDLDACYMLALWYNIGDKTLIDFEKYEFWINKIVDLAKSNNSEAQWKLSNMLRFSDLVTFNLEDSNLLIEKAAKNNHPEAQHTLGYFYEFGASNYPQDLLLANYWYQRAFKNNNPETIYNYGVVF